MNFNKQVVVNGQNAKKIQCGWLYLFEKIIKIVIKNWQIIISFQIKKKSYLSVLF